MSTKDPIKQIEEAGKKNRFDNYSIHVATEFYKSMKSMGTDNALSSALCMVGGHNAN